MRIYVLAALMLAAQGPASAQRSQADVLKSMGIKIVEPMSADQLARTRQKVAAEIARAGASAVFEDISDVNGGRVRHTPSGLVCPVGKKGQQILLATGDAAACETRADGKFYRSSVQRAPAGATIDWAAQYAQATAGSEPGYKPSKDLRVVGGKVSRGSDTVEHRSLQYSSKASGRERNVRVQTGLIRGWLLTERQETSRGAQPNMMADLLSETTFGMAMKAK